MRKRLLSIGLAIATGAGTLVATAGAASAAPCEWGPSDGRVAEVNANWDGLHAGRTSAHLEVTAHVIASCDVSQVTFHYTSLDDGWSDSIELQPVPGPGGYLDADWTGVVELRAQAEKYRFDGITVDAMFGESTLQGEPRNFTVVGDSAVSVSRSASVVTYGQYVRIYAKAVEYTYGSPEPRFAAPVHLWARRHGTTTWRHQGYLWSNSEGLVTFRPTPGVWTDYQVRVPAYGGRAASVSGITSVNVRPKVTAAFNRTSISRGYHATLSGSVAPNRAGQWVSLKWKSPTGWRTVAGKQLTSASGYSFTVKLTSRGVQSYQVVKPADAGYATGSSPIRAITVR